jgi:acylpyruvate hydrolase
MGRTPPEYLHDGDLVETEIEGIGVLRNRVRDVTEPPRA